MKLQHRLETAAASLVSSFVRLLPRSAALALGRGLGSALGACDRRHREIAVANLRASFPDWDEARLYATARGVYRHFGAILLDILWLEGRSAETFTRLIEFEGEENLQKAVAAGKGVLYCTAHIGNWEVNAAAHAILHENVGVLARPLDNPALDARLCGFREAFGNTVIYKRKALAQVIRLLRAGRSVAVLLDQNVQRSDGIFISFFGRPAATTTVAAALALKTGCALVPAHAVLLADGRYRLRYEPALHVDPDPKDREVEIARLTQLLAARTEAWIRERPEQWLWIHRRWKTQPEPGA